MGLPRVECTWQVLILVVAGSHQPDMQDSTWWKDRQDQRTYRLTGTSGSAYGTTTGTGREVRTVLHTAVGTTSIPAAVHPFRIFSTIVDMFER
jgi:hypothetical protein